MSNLRSMRGKGKKGGSLASGGSLLSGGSLASGGKIPRKPPILKGAGKPPVPTKGGALASAGSLVSGGSVLSAVRPASEDLVRVGVANRPTRGKKKLGGSLGKRRFPTQLKRPQ